MTRKTQIPQEDIWSRISFLYQAAYRCLQISGAVGMCRFHTNTLLSIARKSCLSLKASEDDHSHMSGMWNNEALSEHPRFYPRH
ncbi:uncharacterized protein LOC127866886 isoform X2 [Dreissena polymorpha]|uniref:uncharacterized protein LOC127866886 isoform X2 n=1 Tax=Dreissena polymorpha TaxID=45954 RepID=UPI002265220C|nr:uncharacterized protein LOC127866886 isoform X2 [Dreissena polymorpha]